MGLRVKFFIWLLFLKNSYKGGVGVGVKLEYLHHQFHGLTDRWRHVPVQTFSP